MEINWSNFQRLSRENVSKYAVASPGVYILWKKVARYEWECFYVGQAQNLEQQLLNHLSSTEPNHIIKETIATSICGFQFSNVIKQPDRDAIEQYLYEKYQPEGNVQEPGGVSALVNLPRSPRI